MPLEIRPMRLSVCSLSKIAHGMSAVPGKWTSDLPGVAPRQLDDVHREAPRLIARSARDVPADLKARAQLTAEALRNKIQSRYLLYWQAMARTSQWQICTIPIIPDPTRQLTLWVGCFRALQLAS
jgi:hypothetical protein